MNAYRDRNGWIQAQSAGVFIGTKKSSGSGTKIGQTFFNTSTTGRLSGFGMVANSKQYLTKDRV